MKTNSPTNRRRGRIRALAIASAIAIAATTGVVATATANADIATTGSSLCKKELKQGSSGDCVKKLQTRINELGMRHKLGVDGAFGKATRNAVEAFQGRASLYVDGVVGNKTLAKLAKPGKTNMKTESAAAVKKLIRDVFPAGQETKALDVAKCESGYDPLAVGRNTNNTRDYGIFEFNDGGTLKEYLSGVPAALDATKNVKAAYELYKDRGWQPWTCA